MAQVGDAVKLSVEIKDPNGDLFDPPRLEFTMTLSPKHDSTSTTYIYSDDPELVRDSEGKYYVIWYCEADDAHNWGFYAFDAPTGGKGIAAEENTFKVKASKVRTS